MTTFGALSDGLRVWDCVAVDVLFIADADGAVLELGGRVCWLPVLVDAAERSTDITDGSSSMNGASLSAGLRIELRSDRTAKD